MSLTLWLAEDRRVRALNCPCGQARLGTALVALRIRRTRSAEIERRRARSSRLPWFFPPRGKSGKPGGGRPAGRVLAYLLNPPSPKKVAGFPKKVKNRRAL